MYTNIESLCCALQSNIQYNVCQSRASQVVLVVKNLPANAGDIRDVGSIPGSGRPPGGRHSNPLHYSCLENCMDRGAWRATVHRVAKRQTRLKQLHTHTHTAVTQLHVRYMLSCFSHVLFFATL